jgi:hypothetical protein
MSLEAEHEAVKLVATQRCFYLFAALLLLLIAIPFLEGSPRGLVTLNVINVFVLIAAVTGVLYLAILIARLAGVYSPSRERA